jgi:hypothetical protein
MSAEEVRSTLDGLKKDSAQDVFVFSEKESAQIFYDEQGKVTAISVDYFGDNSNAPSPDAVLGAGLQAKPDGSMYQLNRYPAAGYGYLITVPPETTQLSQSRCRKCELELIVFCTVSPKGATTQKRVPFQTLSLRRCVFGGNGPDKTTDLVVIL